MRHSVDLASLRRLATSSLLCFIGWIAFSQNIPIGTWRTHFSYLDARILVVTSDKIFCATEIGLFSRELSDGSVRRLSKIDGLSDVEVSSIAYHAASNVLVVGYASGFVDFIFEDELLSISDIANTDLVSGKSINDIAFGNETTYLATDLGVVVVNTASATVEENFVQIGMDGAAVEVEEILLRNDRLFIRTDEGIQSGSLNSNLLDFASWTRYSATSGFLDLTLVADDIYAYAAQDLWQLDGNTWTDTGIDLPVGVSGLYEVDGALHTTANGIIYQLGGSGFEQVMTTNANSVNDLASDGADLYIADGTLGLIDEGGNQLSPSGPLTNIFSNFRVIANVLYGFHAPSPFTYDGSEQQTAFSRFSDGGWASVSIPNFTNVSDVINFNGSLYYASIGDGLYDESTESILNDIPGSSAELDTMITALGGGAYLWVSSFGNSSPVNHMDQDQQWTSYASVILGSNEYLSIDVSDLDIAWFGSSDGTITVIDPANVDSDQINTSDGLPSFFIDIDISVEDNAWVATNRGPALFSDASFVFSDSEAILPTFENRTLFEDEQINAVLTDGGNRVWFGTNQGVWVYDENTTEQVAQYNVSNSPLPSDNIIQMAYDGSNGEVFIYTDKGLVSYRSASSVGNRDHRNVNIFPNPVRPDYQGLVGLTGLARNVSVKVTDVNGNLVKEIEASGGSASWNLTNARGGSVATGVYLFFSSSADGEETYVGKIAVVR